jgi:hypothetical protein
MVTSWLLSRSVTKVGFSLKFIYLPPHNSIFTFFLTSKIWPNPKQLAKNTEKCGIDSFFETEDDPTKIRQFSRAVRPQQKLLCLFVRDCKTPSFG